VYRFCHQFLPGAGFTGYEHSGVGVGNLVDEAKDFLDYLGTADYVGSRTLGLGKHAPQAPVLLLDRAEMDHLAKQFSNRAQRLDFFADLFDLVGKLVRRKNAHAASLVEDGDAQEGQLGPVQGFARSGPVEEMSLLAQIGYCHGTTGLSNLAGDSFARPVADLSGFHIDPAGDIKPCLSGLQIQNGDHPALHSEARAENVESFLQLVLEFARVAKNPGYLVQRSQFN
jgi:hypothetical protein